MFLFLKIWNNNNFYIKYNNVKNLHQKYDFFLKKLFLKKWIYETIFTTSKFGNYIRYIYIYQIDFFFWLIQWMKKYDYTNLKSEGKKPYHRK